MSIQPRFSLFYNPVVPNLFGTMDYLENFQYVTDHLNFIPHFSYK